MDHAREIELIELAARRLEAERQKAVLAHLENCPACRAKWQDIQKTWDLLGAWEVHPAGHVNIAGHGAAVAAPREHVAPVIVRFPGLRVAARIAAAIAISVLAGYAVGHGSLRPTPTGAGREPPPYFSVLGLEVGDSFSSLVLQDEPSSRQEG